MDHEKVIEIRPAQWSQAAALVLAEALPYGDMADIQADIENGAKLFEATCAGSSVGFYVLRVDQFENFAEGVIVAGVGDAAGVDLTAALLPTIEKQFAGCRSVRIHTARPGLAKKLAAAGYRGAELILRKTL